MRWQEISEQFDYVTVENPETLEWYDPAQHPFAVEGLNWFDEEKKYMRFSEKDMEEIKKVTEAVYGLAFDTAGGQMRFITDSDAFAVAVKLYGPSGMDHFAATGESGVDLYLRYPNEKYVFEGVSRFDRKKDNYAVFLAQNRGNVEKEAVINLPTYASPQKVYIGLSRGAQVKAPKPHANKGRVVVYGSSITQGGCVTRPGMLYTNILSRRMDREFINFGFSGSGMGEKEVAQCIEKVTDPALYILTYEPNAHEIIKTTMDTFIAVLREHHPETPILVVSRLPVASSWHNVSPDVQHTIEKLADYRAWQQNCVKQHNEAGDKNIYYLDGRTLMPVDPDECFVDGIHPTDLGFRAIADNLQPVLEKLL